MLIIGVEIVDLKFGEASRPLTQEMCFSSHFAKDWKEARKIIYLARSTGRHAGVLGGETWGPLPPERITT